MTSQRGVVLVGDDEHPFREFVTRVLAIENFKVIEAASGDAAVTVLNGDARVDLLLADLRMPGMPGEEMTRLARLARPDLKILYISGFIDQLLDGRPLLWAGEAFLEKPITIEGLIEAVSLLLYGSLKLPE